MKEITFFSEGEKYWYLNGLLHREDGPAYEGYNGYKEWWLNDEEYSEYEYKKALEEYKKNKLDNA
jgi:hypothetical protein